MRTQNDIFRELCGVLDHAEAEMGISTSEWPVLARGQQILTNGDKVVLVDKINTRRRGWQDTRDYVDGSGRLHSVWEWIEESTYQISCVRKRLNNDTPDTMTADDIAMRLQTWLNTDDAAEYMRERGLAPLWVSQVTPSTYTDDNDVYQRYTHFDLNVEVVQRWDRVAKQFNAIEQGIVHVPYCNHGESAAPIVWEEVWSDGGESGESEVAEIVDSFSSPIYGIAVTTDNIVNIDRRIAALEWEAATGGEGE